MDKKGALVLLGLAGTILGALALGRLARAAPPGEAAVTIQFYPVGSRIPLAGPGPATLVAGTSYQMKVTVRNKTTQYGALIATNLDVAYFAGTGVRTFVPSVRLTASFLADESKTFISAAFTVPSAAVGEIGNAIANVFAPTGAELASMVEPINVVAAPITYSATVGIIF